MKNMALPVLLALHCTLATLPVSGAEDHNLILKRAYTYFPVPMYHDSKDEGDIHQLTDGVTQYAGGMWMNKSCVGWGRPPDVPIVMHFDLGEEATLNELRFNTCGGGGAGVVEVGLRIFMSLDDKTYVPGGVHEAPPPPDGRNERFGVQIKVPLGGARARYVAIVALAPPPFYFVFVDEIEILGRRPADARSQLPVQSALTASGAQGLQELLAGGKRFGNLMAYLTGPVERHIRCWPARHAEAQRRDIEAARQRASTEKGGYEQVRAEFTVGHRDRARQVYGRQTLVWEVPPDDASTMLSLPMALSPPQRASVHTAVNALEATALGVANLGDGPQPLKVVVTGSHVGGPAVTPRVGRYFETTNARYVPDALLLTDSPQVIPSGESRLVWIGVESTGAKAGVYDYEVGISVGDAAHRIPLNVRVHDVTLSRDTPMWNGNWSDLNNGEHPLFPLVRQSMLEHRITIGAGGGVWPRPEKDDDGNLIRPITMDTTDLEKFIAFHRDFPYLTIFVAFHQQYERPQRDWFGPVAWMSDDFKEVFTAWMKTIIGCFRSGGRDYDQFAIMMFDETLDDKVAQACRLAHAVDPNVRIMITHSSASVGATRHMVDAGMNIFCHHAVRIGYDGPDGYEMLRSGGRQLWFYGAADAAYGGGKERDPLGFFRYLHWIAFRHGATGVHFWNMLHNNGGSPIWGPETVEDNYWPMVYPNHPRYPGPPADVRTAEQVIPSRRWEYVRMGIEDYMLLKMARERIDRRGDAAARQARELEEILKAAITNRDTDRTLFRAWRRQLLELVEALRPD